jgi:hypothetical protein
MHRSVHRVTVLNEGVHRTARRPCSTAGPADHAGVLVGDRADAPRACASVAGVARQLETTLAHGVALE